MFSSLYLVVTNNRHTPENMLILHLKISFIDFCIVLDFTGSPSHNVSFICGRVWKLVEAFDDLSEIWPFLGFPVPTILHHFIAKG